jgi:hypothetical protein
MKPEQMAGLEFSVKNSGCYAAILQDDLLDLIATAKEVERLKVERDELCLALRQARHAIHEGGFQIGWNITRIDEAIAKVQK